MNNNNTLVELANVNKTFNIHHFFQKDETTDTRFFYRKKTIEAARQVSFSIKKGEIFGLLGPNGAGKTTTVKMISGLVRPTAGKVTVAGMHVESKRLKVLRKIGVVLEGTRTIIWPLTPYENLMYFGNLKDVKGAVLKKRAKELLDFIGMKDKMNVQVRTLSRGQKQKVAICVALIADPEVLLLDEPTTGLDVQTARLIKDKIIEMTRNQGKAVLVTTHDMHVAQQLCDRIGIIDEGRLITCKPTGELLDLFSDQLYQFRVDSFPHPTALLEIKGVLSVDLESEDNSPMLCIAFDEDEKLRSEAIYNVMDMLRTDGITLKSVTQRQQTLESVFLKLTTSSV